MPQGKISDQNSKIVIIVPKELKAEADRIAYEDGRSLSGWVRKLIIDAINEHNDGNAK